ncbi:PAS domain-containing sensor histidine kinase [Flavobacterium wongokense]|uniref:PAS domain-containing sensor histidine kinase n=1 Tax=Flavobacterium wongokense TaxID=2910674 RepID=UPI001F2EDB56|nr:PAS domain-containing sensor histidine kinase [Flavobacterium sp. WG47]MCF6131695.1 PAS domain-containing protein [Flavobacterium sp. WG47]
MFSIKQGTLSKSGGMGEIISSNDWSGTPVGIIDIWPLGLRSTLGIMLNSKFPMFLFWGDELTCFYNDACHLSLGIEEKHAEILGKSGATLLSDVWLIILPIIEKLKSNGEPSWYEDQWFPILRKGKKENTYWTSSYSPVNDELGKLEGVLVTMNDVTDKVETRKKMEEAEERTRLATEIAQMATWDLDLQTHSMIHSESLASIFGHQRNTRLSYQEILEQLNQDDLVNIVEKAFEHAMRTGTYKYEARINKQNGETGWVRSHGKIFFDANNEPLKIVGTLIEITEEVNRREILMKNESKFRLLADSMPQLIWTANAVGTLDYYNLSVFTYTGKTTLSIEIGDWLQFVHQNEREEYKEKWKTAMATGSDFIFEHRLLKHDGEHRWQLSHAIAQKDLLGNIQMWVGTSTDIQSQKTFTDELEKQVIERTAELEINNINLVKINIELQSFVYVSSHDLQEPLRKIQTFISRMMDTEEMNFSPTAKAYFDRINIAAKRMQSLIIDLLEYSRTNLTDKVFVLKDLQELAEEVREDYSELILDTHATVDIHILCEARVIPFQFRQLLNNLLGNALKFKKNGTAPYIEINGSSISGKTIISLGADPDLTYNQISVSDNGIGFSMQYKEKIFEVFQRLHGKVEYSGTGIGLAIVKKIVDNHKGIITAEATENEGAVFTIYIPEL